MATGLEQTAVNPHNLQSGQVRRSVGGLAATALDPLRRAYQAYQQYVGQPFQQAVRGGVRGYFGLPMMTDADALGREAYRQAEALGYTPGVGMPAGAVRLAAEGVQALPSIAGDIGRVIAGMPSGAGSTQAEDFARYQRSIPPSDVSPLTAFHGTPHRFEPTPANPLGEFRAAKIGSGEGAQAYGYGLYFAESPGVANQYKVNLSRGSYFDAASGKNIDSGEVLQKAVQSVQRTGIPNVQRPESARQIANQIMDWVDKRRVARSFLLNHIVPKELEPAYESAIDAFENLRPVKGSLYTVDIPDSMVEKMLDWDKPLSKQPEAMRVAKDVFNDPRRKQAGFPNLTDKEIGEMTGEQLYQAMSATWRGGQRGASDSLRQAGIPGIRYLDAGSRGSADGTRNIVVFPGEESKVKILKRD